MKVVLVMAMSADGIIAKTDSHIADWTTSVDKKAFATETKKHGVIIMGKNTFDTIGRALPERLNVILTSSPEKYKDLEQAGVLEFTNVAPKELLASLEQRGYQSVALGGGAKTNAAFFKENLVDELLITIVPKMFGTGLKISEGADLNVDLELLETVKLDTNVIQQRYRIKK